VCFKYDDGGAILRETFNFGQFPIMLQVCYFVILHLLLKFPAYENALMCIVKLDDTSSEILTLHNNGLYNAKFTISTIGSGSCYIV
jgi:hypothetical protein